MCVCVFAHIIYYKLGKLPSTFCLCSNIGCYWVGYDYQNYTTLISCTVTDYRNTLGNLHAHKQYKAVRTLVNVRPAYYCDTSCSAIVRLDLPETSKMRLSCVLVLLLLTSLLAVECSASGWRWGKRVSVCVCVCRPALAVPVSCMPAVVTTVVLCYIFSCSQNGGGDLGCDPLPRFLAKNP